MTVFKHLLVPTDFGEAAGRALELAISLATPSEAKITLLHACWIPPMAYAGLDTGGLYWPTDAIANAAKKQLEAAITLAKTKLGYPRIEPLVVTGSPWEQILSAAKTHGVDLIVMGTHGRQGMVHALLGSVAEKVVRLSPVPVLTVGAPAERQEGEKGFFQATIGRK
jgi:nucleotide-binding universal stress UspA family protein